ncbi:transmembrane protein 131-like isoform X1 [Pygocentrus nattereri]|uniref:Transmembrane 131 like n=1 Tax=Pygocentrus nattereri TaxID=42514 RepID=A0A3B4CPU4_PYGNA|nr:transmembrane protein 131-like isoform X1 [Pygocentrus nattereri]
MATQRDLSQIGHCHRKTWINIFLGILQLFLPFIQRGGAQFQALTEMSSVVEVWQAEEADFLAPSQAVEEQSTESLPQEDSSSFYVRDSGRPLHFQPSVLDFGTQPVGLPRAETVHIHNPSSELPVTLQSIYTSSSYFHMPSFHRRVIPPRGKTSFKLIFLPTEEGNVENSLFINTSTHGVITYQVFGVGVSGDSVKDVQKKDSVLIFPHIQSIKLTQTQEDASNITILGLLLDCSLPKALYSHPQSFCFGAEEEGRLSLQINLSEQGERPAHLDKLKPYVLENIMVLLVLPPPGGETPDPRIGVYMLNSGVKQLSVKEIQILSRSESSVEISQGPLKASSSNLTQVAALSCRRPLSSQSKKCSSQISMQILANSTVNIFPWLETTDRKCDSAAWFQFRQIQRGANFVDLWVVNPLPLTFSISNISLTQSTHALFKVVNLTKTVGVASGCWKLLTLHLQNRTLPVNLITVVTLHTSLGFTLELPVHIFSTGSKRGDIVFEAGGECERPCPLRLSKAGRLEWQQSLLPESSSALWRTDSSLASALCSRWHCSKELYCRWPRLPADHSTFLDFGATPVNESKIKNFTLKNPTGSVVSVEIRTLSSYPAPLEALDLLTKWFNISPLSVNITTTEFSLFAADHKCEESCRGSNSVQRVVLQPWESKTVSVAYIPTEHKPVTSLLLIRNNLTVFDLVLVKGFGAKELLRVGGKLPGPGASLRFNVPQSTLMECRDGLRSNTNKPLFAIQKSFKVENAGELPLTVMSMNINGYKCQGFGFEVLQCRSFSVDYNSSSEITIAFTPDFTSSWVIRDLTLVTARGSAFPFTLNVTLPHHMLPLCAQVVPGPSWEESFWVITLVFTCFSLAGVCLMAFHQAQYILREFSTPTPRSNHNSTPRENGSVSHSTSNSVSRGKGSCKNYSDTSHTSDKGKGRGSTAVANGTVRSQSSSKKGSGGSSQPQKKQTHKVSFLYSRYKSSSSAASAVANSSNPLTDEEREEPVFEQDPDICNNNNNNNEDVLDESLLHMERKECYEEVKVLQGDMFPMEILPVFPESIIANQVPQLVDGEMENRCNRKRDEEKRENAEAEREIESTQKKRVEKDSELGSTFSTKAKKNSGKSRRRTAETAPGLPENSVVMVTESERDAEGREARNAAKTRNHSVNMKLEIPKAAVTADSSLKQNGVCAGRVRRKVPERRQWESGSDSGSSTGSVRASRGSWGSWSSASSMEGEKDPNRAHCNSNNSRKREPAQYNMYSTERECYPPTNCTFKAQSMNSLYVKDTCQSPETPAHSQTPSFTDVAAGVDWTPDCSSAYIPDETWSAPSVPLTNGFRYSMPDPISLVSQSSTPSPYSGSFPWNNSSQCNNLYTYSHQNNYMLPGNGNYQNSFPSTETQTMAHGQQASWSEDGVQEVASSWDMTSCVGSKPFFSGTRSLSPISSSLFGSIWTPQSEPYQSHFQPDRSAPVSPHSPHTPHTPFSREPGPPCPPKHYSSFNPFGPHMNLDIWNSSSNRSSNSQLSNDSGYCGDA